MTDHQHLELAKVLHAVKGMVAISNYQCPLMDGLYPAPRWHKIVGPPRTNHATKGTRVELLWVNYKPQNKPLNDRNGYLFEDSE
jgi:DNA adenine methylase